MFNYTVNLYNTSQVCNWTNCIKNQPCDVIEMREMRGEVGKKTHKKEMDNPLFL